MKHDLESAPAGAAGMCAEDEARLLALVKEYQELLEAGAAPDRVRLLMEHADIAGPLADCLDALELVQRAAPAPAREFVPCTAQALGDFRIVREIGRGGMGIVYEAVQLSLGRRVALKVLSFAAALDERRLQRFKNEAHAAAQLHHSNIVPVYAVGSERGVHFYAMQLIDGQPLTAVVKELRQHSKSHDPDAATRPAFAALGTDAAGAAPQEVRARPFLSLPTDEGRDRAYFRTIARLGKQAAEALEHAHQMGVVHRDVKPGNLLLDNRGNLWVADFGLALLASEAGITRTGDIVGTLCYMSPEQVAGDRLLLDHRTDVYSLGAALYELLALRPAFDDHDAGRLIERIRRDDPTPPRHFERAIPAELETIVLKALAKSPAERYPTAAALAEDLDRFLKDQPIRARRPSPAERLRKWARRHPSVVWATLVLLVAALIGLLVNNALVERERRKAELAYERELERARIAEARFQKARDAVDLLIRVAEEELTDQPVAHHAHRRLLEAALSYYQSFIEERRDDPRAQAELTLERERVEQLVADLGAFRGGPPDLLFQSPPLRDELRLSAEQDEQLSRLGQRFKEKRGAILQTPNQAPAQRRRRFAALAREQDKALAELFSVRQRERLHQVSVQMRGLWAFQDSDVIEALGLTDEQRRRIREIETNDRFAGAPPFDGPPGPPPHEKRQRQSLERVEQEVLTPEQLQRWQRLKGPPFAGRLGPLPPLR